MWGGGRSAWELFKQTLFPAHPHNPQPSDWLANPSVVVYLFVSWVAEPHQLVGGGGSSITNVRGEDSEEAAVDLVSVQMKYLVSLNVL